MEMVVAEECCSSPARRGWVRGNVVGVGAFGTVSLAMNKANGELFAVKSIECREQARSGLLALENEGRILQELDSPWIVTCLGHDCTEENGVRMWNLFMEYMAGGSVADILKKFGGKLDESVIRTYTRDILQGIHYLHGEGIVHCDIKGKNVLLGSSGVKLADFGSAKRMGRNGENELIVGDPDPRQLRGTPLWMAPEVVKQEEQGPASDIWSLGCTVIEMASGRSPWSDIAHPLAALYRIGCTDEIPELPQSLSPEGLDFLEKCFRRDPKQRWTSAQLLNHPFLNECFPFQANQEPKELRSPTSILDFHLSETQWDSDSCTLSQTIPILSLQQGLPPSKQTQECRDKEMRPMRPNGKILSPSPTQRMLDFAEKLKENSVWGSTAAVDGVFGSSPLGPLGQWIVVRSPKGMPPRLDGPFTDFIDGFETGKLSSSNPPKVECSTQLESGDCEDAELRRKPLKSETPVVDQIREFNHGPSQSSVYGDSLTVIDNLVQASLCARELIFRGPLQNCKYSSNLFLCTGESTWESWIIKLLEFEFFKPLLSPIFCSQNKDRNTLACGIQRKRISSLQLIQQTKFCQKCFKPMSEVADLRQSYSGIATDWCRSKDPVLDSRSGASCCSCFIICRTKYCCKSRMMGIPYVDGGADECLCNFIEVIISVQFTWLHFWVPAPLGWKKLAFFFHLITFGIIFSFIFVHRAIETSNFEKGQETAKKMDFPWPFQ